jgi:hypothetical protein
LPQEDDDDVSAVSARTSSAPDLLLPKAISLGLPCPELLQPPKAAKRSFLLHRLPGILAAAGMLALLVTSVVALWPAAGAPDAHIASPAMDDVSVSLPRKFLDKCASDSSLPLYTATASVTDRLPFEWRYL